MEKLKMWITVVLWPEYKLTTVISSLDMSQKGILQINFVIAEPFSLQWHRETPLK